MVVSARIFLWEVVLSAESDKEEEVLRAFKEDGKGKKMAIEDSRTDISPKNVGERTTSVKTSFECSHSKLVPGVMRNGVC